MNGYIGLNGGIIGREVRWDAELQGGLPGVYWEGGIPKFVGFNDVIPGLE